MNELSLDQSKVSQSILSKDQSQAASLIDSIESIVSERSHNCVDSAADRQQLISLAFTIAKSKKAVSMAAKSQIALIRSNSKYIIDSLDEMKIRVRKPVTDWEDAEKKKRAQEQERAESMARQKNFFEERMRAMRENMTPVNKEKAIPVNKETVNKETVSKETVNKSAIDHINDQIITNMNLAGINKSKALLVISMINSGAIPHITINYPKGRKNVKSKSV